MRIHCSNRVAGGQQSCALRATFIIEQPDRHPHKPRARRQRARGFPQFGAVGALGIEKHIYRVRRHRRPDRKPNAFGRHRFNGHSG